MKVKVLRTFKDKHTGEYHRKGDVLTVTKKRFDEILKVAPLVKKLEEEAEETPTPAK